MNIVTAEDIKIILIGIVIFVAIYLFLFLKKGINRKSNGYLGALGSCILYSIMFVFIFTAIKLDITVFNKINNYNMIVKIVSLCFTGLSIVLAFIVIKRLLKKDFNVAILFKKKNENNSIQENQEEKRFFTLNYMAAFLIIIFIIAFFILLHANNSISIGDIIILSLICLLLLSVILFFKALFGLGSIQFFKKNFNINPIRVLGIAILIFGVLFIIGFYKSRNIKNATETTATVVDLVYGGENDEGKIYDVPIIQYEVNDKKYLQKIESFSIGENSLFKLKSGDIVKILYNSENPYEAVIKSGLHY